jgi:hypothetical protein
LQPENDTSRPAHSTQRKHVAKDGKKTDDMKKVPYREAVGSLLYLATTTRPDIAFAVGQVSQFCQNPGYGHWNAVKA